MDFMVREVRAIVTGDLAIIRCVAQTRLSRPRDTSAYLIINLSRPLLTCPDSDPAVH